MKKTIIILFISFLFTCVGSAQTNIKQKENINKVITANKTKLNILNERVFTSAIVITELALLLGILFYWKKTHNHTKQNNNNIFKKNIKALRQERLKYFGNEKLSLKRKLLQTKIKKEVINGKIITEKAKRLSISKGEIFLAMRIKQLQTKT